MERALADTLLDSDQSVFRIPHQLSSALDKVQAEPCKTSRPHELPDETSHHRNDIRDMWRLKK